MNGIIVRAMNRSEIPFVTKALSDAEPHRPNGPPQPFAESSPTVPGRPKAHQPAIRETRGSDYEMQ